jgi:hypothetical protein
MTQEQNSNYPLIIVFYLDRSMISNPEIMGPLSEAVNSALAERNSNAIAFFMPTDGPEKVDCINPIQIEAADMEKINQIVEDIKKNFDVQEDLDEN